MTIEIGAGEASAPGPVGAEEANGGGGSEPDGASHQRNYDNPQSSLSTVPAQQLLAPEASANAIRRTNRMDQHHKVDCNEKKNKSWENN